MKINRFQSQNSAHKRVKEEELEISRICVACLVSRECDIYDHLLLACNPIAGQEFCSQRDIK